MTDLYNKGRFIIYGRGDFDKSCCYKSITPFFGTLTFQKLCPLFNIFHPLSTGKAKPQPSRSSYLIPHPINNDPP